MHKISVKNGQQLNYT